MPKFTAKRTTRPRFQDPDCTFHIFVDPPGAAPAQTYRKDSAFIVCDKGASRSFHDTLISKDLALEYKKAQLRQPTANVEIVEGELIELTIWHELGRHVDKFALPVHVKFSPYPSKSYVRIGLRDLDAWFKLYPLSADKIGLKLRQDQAAASARNCNQYPK